MSPKKTSQVIEIQDVFCSETRAAFRTLLVARKESEEFAVEFAKLSTIIHDRARLLPDE